MTVLHQVGVHPAHIPVGGRQRKRFGRRRGFLPCLRIELSLLPAQEHRHRLREGHSVVRSDKINGVAAGLGLVVKPLVASDGHTVVGVQPIVPAGGKELFPLPPQELSQVHLVGLAFLLFCKVNKGSHRHTSHRYHY